MTSIVYSPISIQTSAQSVLSTPDWFGEVTLISRYLQWNGSATAKPRQVSVLLHPLVIGSLPILWKDWSRRQHRRACVQLLRHQRVEVRVELGLAAALFLNSFHLLPFLLAIPLFLSSLTAFTSGSAQLSLIRSGFSSSTTSLRNSWAQRRLLRLGEIPDARDSELCEQFLRNSL